MCVKEDVLNRIKTLDISDRIGLAGSLARGNVETFRDIDIVVETDSLSFDDVKALKKEFEDFHKNVDVIQLLILKEEEEKETLFLKELGLPEDENSIYKNICREVIWVE